MSIKVLHLSKYYSPYRGGIEQVVLDLCASVDRNMCAADVICINHIPGSLEEERSGVRIYRCNSNIHLNSTDFSFDYITTLRRIISDYDVIHVHLPNPMANLALFFANIKNAKVVVHWHSDIVKQRWVKLLYAPLQTWLLKAASVVVCTTQNYASASKDLVMFSGKVKVIPIGLNDKKLLNVDGIIEKKMEAFPSKKIIFSLGRLVYYKGFDHLIRASQYLPDNFVVLIGGVGPLLPKLKKLVESLELDEKVHFLGSVDEELLGQYFSVANVFCLPSVERSEAFGVVQLEAFSVGTPVVSFDIEGSGVSWVNEHGVSGLVVPSFNDKLLAEALVIASTTLREKLSVGAKDRFVNNFTAEIMRERFLNLYVDA